MDETTYDYIIVGAGSAGSVLAERLSSLKSLRILLIEEGPPGPDWLIDMPRGYGRLLLDHRYTARFAVARGTSTEWWLRGKLLGGSSSVNGTVWLRGCEEDFNSFARSGMQGWGWSDVRPYFDQLERHEPFHASSSSENGLIPIHMHPNRDPVVEAVIAAAIDQGVPRIENENATAEGVAYLQHTINRRGQRVAAKRAFLDPAVKRPNLKVMTRVRADRILFQGKRAIGVACTSRGRPATYRCSGDVIVAAGALASPLLLQRSGIGDARLLHSLGIDVVADNRAVGRNLQEHLTVALQFRAQKRRFSENSKLTGPGLAWNVIRYLLTRGGPLSYGAHQVGMRLRSHPSEPRPDLRIMYAPFSRASDGTRRFEDEPGVQMIGFVLRPESRGSISIVSPDPDVPPHIDPNYLATDVDQRRTVALVRAIRDIMSRPTLSPYLKGETGETAGAQTDAEILAMVRARGAAGFHATSTCYAGGRGAVLDSDLCVQGVLGLRVVDCSIFPSMISGHTNAVAMAAAWRASDLILGE